MSHAVGIFFFNGYRPMRWKVEQMKKHVKNHNFFLADFNYGYFFLHFCGEIIDFE